VAGAVCVGQRVVAGVVMLLDCASGQLVVIPYDSRSGATYGLFHQLAGLSKLAPLLSSL